jgi:exo-beta-1,3-glucanase (GH17 family)
MSVPLSLKAFVVIVVAFACGCGLTYAAWHFEGRLKDIPAAPAGGLVDGKFACLSYAPYRDGQSPFDESFVVPPSQIDQDLTILATHTACVRTYSTDQGLDQVVPIAARHGLKVLLGAWIGADYKKNDQEVASVIRIANAYPDTVSAVIVGNEVLLRREQSSEKLGSYIRQVKAAVKVPVTYADVWEFWLENPKLADDVDFITVHMLPYWEDQPIAVPRALRHVVDVLKKVQAAFPGRKLFVGEIGWPSLGRMREDARPSPSDQARFLREFVAISQNLGVGYNFIEAFDQSWKRASEGTVGGHWGIYDSHRKPKVELSGPVSDDPSWHRNWLIGSGFGLLLLGASVITRRKQADVDKIASAAWLLAAGIFSGIAGAILQSQIIYVSDTALTRIDWASGIAGGVLSVLAALFAIKALVDRASGAEIVAPMPMRAVLDTIACGRLAVSRRFLAGVVETLVLAFGLATALSILTDGRYRDFPTAVYLTPAIAFVALRIAAGRSRATDDPPASVLAIGLAIVAPATVINESLGNTQALGWSATTFLLCLPWLVEAVRSGYARWRAMVASPKTNPIEAGPAL